MLLLVGCALLRLDPTIDEDHTVTPLTDASRTLTVLEPMFWADDPIDVATKGIRLDEGTYLLEAEDVDYLYFRAPKPIEVRVLKDGAIVDRREMPGGLALAKGFKWPPAATYVDKDATTKTLIFKHGSNFLRLRDETWKKSF